LGDLKTKLRSLPVPQAGSGQPRAFCFVKKGVVWRWSTAIPMPCPMLHELAPSATTFVMLLNPNSPTSDGQAKAVLEAVSRVGLAFHVSRVTPEVDLDKVFAAMPQLHGVALLVGGDAYLMSRGEQIVALAKRYRLPAIYDRREYAELGGLMSYGTRLTDAYRQMGVYAGRILKGAEPADLPVVQPTRFELVVNLGVAKALGLAVPQTLQVAADEVIE
jgi:putative tryptophan/tyrosine transport system substrate-binding protein